MKKIVLTFGILSGLVSAALMFATLPFLEKIGFDKGLIVGYTGIVLSLLFVYFGVRSYRDNKLGGKIGFGRAFGVGLLITLISCVFYVVSWQILSRNFMPDFADQYAARIGVATSVKTVGVNLGLRWEGTRGSDLIGGDRGRRRPGYTLGLDPGLSYGWHGNFVSLNVPIAIRRVRNQNFADKLASEESGHFENGDAAFADYALVLGFSRRF